MTCLPLTLASGGGESDSDSVVCDTCQNREVNWEPQSEIVSGACVDEKRFEFMLAITSPESHLPLVACTDSHQIVGATEVQLVIDLHPLKAIQEFNDQ